MKARELMRDGPTIKELFDRCISTDYEVDSHDFFYMQAMSERLSLRSVSYTHLTLPTK